MLSFSPPAILSSITAMGIVPSVLDTFVWFLDGERVTAVHCLPVDRLVVVILG